MMDAPKAMAQLERLAAECDEKYERLAAEPCTPREFFDMVLDELRVKARDVRTRHWCCYGQEMVTFRGDVAFELKHVTKAKMSGKRYEPVVYGLSAPANKRVL